MGQRSLPIEQQVIFFLGYLGVPYSQGLSYLRYSLPLFLNDKVQPSKELWEQIAKKFGKKPENVCSCIQNAVHRAWLKQNVFWKEYLGVHECPNIPKFYQLTAAWIKGHEIVAVDTGKAFSETAVIPKSSLPKVPDGFVK